MDCHGQTNRKLERSTNDGFMREATNLELEVMRIETQEVGSDETRNLKRVERHKRMNIEMKIKETRWGKEIILD